MRTTAFYINTQWNFHRSRRKNPVILWPPFENCIHCLIIRNTSQFYAPQHWRQCFPVCIRRLDSGDWVRNWFHWFSYRKLFFRLEMSSNRGFKTISKKYFNPMENDSFKCKCGKTLKRNGSDWSILMVHIRTLHETTPSGPQNTLDFMQCKKSQTIHDWTEWKCVELRPSIFVESENVKKRVKLEAISWILCKVHASPH